MVFVRQLRVIPKSIFSLPILKSIPRITQTIKIDVSSRKLITNQLLRNMKKIKVTFVNEDGDKIEAQGKVGETMMQLALKNSVYEPDDLCDGDIWCHHCNFTFSKEDYEKLPEPERDEIMHLDSYRYPIWSRMGCQIQMTADLDGIEIKKLQSHKPPRQPTLHPSNSLSFKDMWNYMFSG